MEMPVEADRLREELELPDYEFTKHLTEEELAAYMEENEGKKEKKEKKKKGKAMDEEEEK